MELAQLALLLPGYREGGWREPTWREACGGPWMGQQRGSPHQLVAGQTVCQGVGHGEAATW